MEGVTIEELNELLYSLKVKKGRMKTQWALDGETTKNLSAEEIAERRKLKEQYRAEYKGLTAMMVEVQHRIDKFYKKPKAVVHRKPPVRRPKAVVHRDSPLVDPEFDSYDRLMRQAPRPGTIKQQ